MIHSPVQIEKVESMSKSTVIDRWGNEIYITSERWEHILERHDELTYLFDEVLETLRDLFASMIFEMMEKLSFAEFLEQAHYHVGIR